METLGPILIVLILSLITGFIVVRSENKYREQSQRAKERLSTRLDPTFDWQEFEKTQKEQAQKVPTPQADSN